LVVPVKEVALNDSTTSQAPLLRNRFKVRRTQVPNQVPNKNREELIKHREALPSKTKPEFIKPQHVVKVNFKIVQITFYFPFVGAFLRLIS
jgi:hypothetical protein